MACKQGARQTDRYRERQRDRDRYRETETERQTERRREITTNRSKPCRLQNSRSIMYTKINRVRFAKVDWNPVTKRDLLHNFKE